MSEHSLLKRLFYSFLGYLFWFTYFTSTHHILGISLAALLKLLPVGLALAAWLNNWGNIALMISILLLIWIFLSYWYANRSGYLRFVAGPPSTKPHRGNWPLAPYERVECIASGIYSVHDWEKNVLLRPAAYWQVPRGDHVVMVEHEPQRYLYQFFDVATLFELQEGWLLHGVHPMPAISITYLSMWGPEFTQQQISIFGSESKPIEPKPRTIYLSFPNEDAENLICGNILGDMQRHQDLQRTE